MKRAVAGPDWLLLLSAPSLHDRLFPWGSTQLPLHSCDSGALPMAVTCPSHRTLQPPIQSRVPCLAGALRNGGESSLFPFR